MDWTSSCHCFHLANFLPVIDHFFTIESEGQALLKEKSSKFYAYAFPISSEQEVEQKIKILKKEHLKSRHHCYAYIIGADKLNFRANDDGEPSGTAGRPILGQIEKRNLTNTLVVVVRYFGGTKLGTSGLIKAYKESASLALEETKIIEEFITSTLKVTCTFEQIGSLMNIISKRAFNISKTLYAEHVHIDLQIRLSEIEASMLYIKAKMLNRSTADIKKDTSVPGMAFSIE